MIKARVNLSRQADEEIDKENNPIFGNTGQIKPYNNVSKCQRKKTPSLSVSRNNCSKQGVSVELGRYVSHNPDDIMSP